MMPRITVPVIAMAGVSFYLGLYHLSLHLRRPDGARRDLRFAAMAMLIALYDSFSAGLYASTSVAEGEVYQRLQLVTLSFVAISLAYFVDAYSGVAMPRLAQRIAWLCPALGVIALVERSGLLFSDAESIKHLTLPWFGEVTYYERGPGPLLYLITLIVPYAAGYLAFAAHRMWRGDAETRRRARFFTVGVGLFVLGTANDGLVSTGELRNIYVIEYAWTSMILLVGYALSSEVVEAALAKQALAESRERLAHAERLESVGQLAGGVAHDLNNMLTPVLAYAQLAQKKMAKDAPEREFLDHVIAAAERAAALTRQLLAFGRKQMLEVRPVDVRAALRELEPLLRRLLPESITLRIHCADAVPTISADVAQLEQIWMNLVANARDAMPNGGSIEIEVKEIEVTEIGSRLEVSVKDDGEGMDRETVDRIFEPFFTTKPRGKGTGLGLSTVHGIVRQHGGRITVESAKGRGTTFRLVFPTIARAPTRSLRRDDESLQAMANQHVLVVDDERAVQDLVRDVLSSHGYRVDTAGSEAELREVLARATEPFDLLLTDVVLPDTDGTKISAIVAKHHPDAIVLYMSGHAEDVLGARGVRRETVELLPKPFTADALVSKVRTMIARELTR